MTSANAAFFSGGQFLEATQVGALSSGDSVEKG